MYEELEDKFHVGVEWGSDPTWTIYAPWENRLLNITRINRVRLVEGSELAILKYMRTI